MSDFTHYFALVDAADDSKLKNYFYRAPLFDRVKKGKQDFWTFVIHGIKGAGKTALCNMVRKTIAAHWSSRLINRGRLCPGEREGAAAY